MDNNIQIISEEKEYKKGYFLKIILELTLLMALAIMREVALNLQLILSY